MILQKSTNLFLESTLMLMYKISILLQKCKKQFQRFCSHSDAVAAFLHMLYPYLSSFPWDRRGENLYEFLSFGDLVVFSHMNDVPYILLRTTKQQKNIFRLEGRTGWYSKPESVMFVMNKWITYSFTDSLKLPLRNTKIFKTFCTEHGC